MRGSRWFIFFVLAFLLLMFAIEYHLPKKFVWVPTFGHYDEQPFGCAVFDSLLTVSLPSGYTLSRKTFYQMEQEDTVHNKGILLIATNLPFGRVDIEALLKMADRGNKIMLVSSSFTKILEDTLKFDCTYSYFRSVDLKKYAASLLKRDSIYWIGDPEVYSRQVFRFYPQFCKSYFRRYDSLPVRKLAEVNLASDMGHALDELDSTTVSRNYHPLVAMVRPWGKGEIILVSTPLLFTNYGVLDEKNATYIFRILSQIGEIAYCPHRRIYEGDCTDAAISFALFSVAKAASLGDLSVDVRYLALYGVYSTEAATGNTCHTGTGKQIP